MDFYHKLAKYYDIMYSEKDYAGEVENLHQIITEYKKTQGNDLLEVACGTGSHIEFFQHNYNVVGCDLSMEMVEVARSKFPDIEFLQCDMTDFDLRRRFDVITCLFGSMNYLLEETSFSKAFDCFSQHLHSGGVAIIEPFLLEEHIFPHHVSIHTIDRPELKIARVNSVNQEGSQLTLDFHFLIGTPGKVEHSQDVQLMSVFPIETYLRIMDKSGMDAVHIKPEWARSGLLVGVKR